MAIRRAKERNYGTCAGRRTRVFKVHFEVNNYNYINNVCVYVYLLDIRWILDDRPQCYNCSDLDVFMSEIMTKCLCKPVK